MLKLTSNQAMIAATMFVIELLGSPNTMPMPAEKRQAQTITIVMRVRLDIPATEDDGDSEASN